MNSTDETLDEKWANDCHFCGRPYKVYKSDARNPERYDSRDCEILDTYGE